MSTSTSAPVPFTITSSDMVLVTLSPQEKDSADCVRHIIPSLPSIIDARFPIETTPPQSTSFCIGFVLLILMEMKMAFQATDYNGIIKMLQQVMLPDGADVDKTVAIMVPIPAKWLQRWSVFEKNVAIIVHIPENTNWQKFMLAPPDGELLIPARCCMWLYIMTQMYRNDVRKEDLHLSSKKSTGAEFQESVPSVYKAIEDILVHNCTCKHEISGIPSVTMTYSRTLERVKNLWQNAITSLVNPPFPPPPKSPRRNPQEVSKPRLQLRENTVHHNQID
ncbi:hypothetical protein LXL04_000353 [Taraxacum kok-saghyz]